MPCKAKTGDEPAAAAGMSSAAAAESAASIPGDYSSYATATERMRSRSSAPTAPPLYEDVRICRHCRSAVVSAAPVDYVVLAGRPAVGGLTEFVHLACYDRVRDEISRAAAAAVPPYPSAEPVPAGETAEHAAGGGGGGGDGGEGNDEDNNRELRLRAFKEAYEERRLDIVRDLIERYERRPPLTRLFPQAERALIRNVEKIIASESRDDGDIAASAEAETGAGGGGSFSKPSLAINRISAAIKHAAARAVQPSVVDSAYYEKYKRYIDMSLALTSGVHVEEMFHVFGWNSIEKLKSHGLTHIMWTNFAQLMPVKTMCYLYEISSLRDHDSRVEAFDYCQLAAPSVSLFDDSIPVHEMVFVRKFDVTDAAILRISVDDMVKADPPLGATGFTKLSRACFKSHQDWLAIGLNRHLLKDIGVSMERFRDLFPGYRTPDEVVSDSAQKEIRRSSRRASRSKEPAPTRDTSDTDLAQFLAVPPPPPAADRSSRRSHSSKKAAPAGRKRGGGGSAGREFPDEEDWIRGLFTDDLETA